MAKIIHITIHILNIMLIKNRLQIMICFEKTIDFTHSEIEKMQLLIQFRLDRGILLGEFLNVDGLPKPWPAAIRLIVKIGMVFPTVDQYDPLRALVTLGSIGCGAPF